MRIAGVALAALVTASCAGPDVPTTPPGSASADAELRALISRWNVAILGDVPTQPPAQVALGQALVFDKILSGNRDVSCATCHDPLRHGGDGLALSVGTGAAGSGLARVPGPGRQFLSRNAPSLLNQGLRSPYVFWDGRVSGPAPGPFASPAKLGILPAVNNILAAQALFPVTSREEMRGKAGDLDVFGNPNELAQFADSQYTAIWQGVMNRLLAIPEYVQLFNAAFPQVATDRLGFEHAAQAIAAFQVAAYTHADSRFDRYLERDDNALSAPEKRGATLFFGTARCASCHGGSLLGGTQIENTGVPQLGPGTTPGAPLDWGRAAFMKDTAQKNRFGFRVPPLRNVELTAPYMHNGTLPTLEAVVRHYANVTVELKAYDPSHLDPAVRALYHGDEATIAAVLFSLNGTVKTPLALDPQQVADLVAFLKSLTDPAAKDLGGLTPARVPSGLPVD